MRLPSQTRRSERGQGLVEFSMIVPVVLLILLGMLEFGFVMDHSASIGNATREGARMGSALVNGGGMLGCPISATVSPNAADVDKRIVAAVQRILAAPGSRVSMADVTEIRIYLSTSTGTETAGKVNVWTYSATGTVTPDGLVNFAPSGAQPWSACSRSFLWTTCGSPPAGLTQCPPGSIGVGIRYNYRFVTPLAAAMGFFGGSSAATIAVSERAVMAMNPN